MKLELTEIPKNYKKILTFISGSNLYGTNTKNSDIDKKGIFIPDKEFYYSFLYNEIKPYNYINEKENVDIEFYEIKHFLELLVNNNPNIIEFLFIPDNMIELKTEEWDEILENKKYFISKICKHSFFGYANQQLYRIKRHRRWLLYPPEKKPERKDFGLLENKSTIPRDQIGAFNVLLAMYLEEIRSFHTLKDQLLKMEETVNFKTMTQNIKNMDSNAVKTVFPIGDNFLELLSKEKAYLLALREWNSYKNWEKNRNLKRKEMEKKSGYDTKHMSHCARIMSEAKELLETGYITFPRPDAEFLLEIKNGKYTYEEMQKMFIDMEKEFNDITSKSNLPETPNKERINEICIHIIENYIKNQKE